MDIRLLSDSCTPWAIPEDAQVLVSYVKPDGTAGAYDTLPDGTQAYSIHGSVLSVMLAPQMLTAVGMVTAQIRLTQGDKVLIACPFGIRVTRSIALDAHFASMPYGDAVDAEIRKRYSVSQEFAILRQKDAKPDEYTEYYAYCEECKARVKEMIGGNIA